MITKTATVLDFNSSSQLSDHINRYIDTTLESANKKEVSRKYLGGSIIGDPCDRKIAFIYAHAPVDNEPQFSGRTLRIFQRGHWGEAAVINWLRQSGVIIKTEDKNGKQFGFSSMSGRFEGHVDGVIVGGPHIFGPFPRLWENKVLGSKGWKKLQKEKLKKAYPVYYGQVSVYSAMLRLDESPVLFSAVNADTMELYWEEILFDAQEAQNLIDRAVKIICAVDNGELPARINAYPETWFECKWCDFQQRCIGLGA